MKFCEYCGREPGEGEHLDCARRHGLEPPRYCPRCARRMVVQVTPSSWSARCSVHGVLGAAAGSGAAGSGAAGSADRNPELV